MKMNALPCSFVDPVGTRCHKHFMSHSSLLCEAPIPSGSFKGPVSVFRAYARDLGDFCEGYKRVVQGHIRLDNFSKICPRFFR